MSFSRINKELYMNIIPFFCIPATFSGFMCGMDANKNIEEDSFAKYANVIGYTSIGFLTGITFPISFPLFGGYVLYKRN